MPQQYDTLADAQLEAERERLQAVMEEAKNQFIEIGRILNSRHHKLEVAEKRQALQAKLDALDAEVTNG